MNCRNEFFEHTVEHTKNTRIKCAVIYYKTDGDSIYTGVCLSCEYSASQFSSFCDALNFNYDASFGPNAVVGTIWYEDGTYSDRQEYDCVGEWVHRKLPPIPEILR